MENMKREKLVKSSSPFVLSLTEDIHSFAPSLKITFIKY